MEKIKLTEQTVLLATQMLTELAANYAVTTTVFYTARENNFLQIYEKNDHNIYKTNQELKISQDPEYSQEVKFVEGKLDLQFERNDGKNSVKFFGKQFPKYRQFLPFGTDLFISADKKYAVAIYTPKDATLTDVTVFSAQTMSEYLQSSISITAYSNLSGV